MDVAFLPRVEVRQFSVAVQAVKLRASSAYYNDAKPCGKYTALFSWILSVKTEERNAGFNFWQFVTLSALLVFSPQVF